MTEILLSANFDRILILRRPVLNRRTVRNCCGVCVPSIGECGGSPIPMWMATMKILERTRIEETAYLLNLAVSPECVRAI